MGDGALQLLLIGGSFGLLVAVVGSLIEYRLHLGTRAGSQSPLPGGLMSLAAGFLAFLGLIAVVISLLATGGIMPAVVMGIGVGLGFYTGFGALLILYLRSQRRRRN